MLRKHKENMKRHNHVETKYIRLYKKNCQACWRRVENCSQKVIRKVDIIIHKHSHFDNSKECIGCIKCVKSCEYDAIRPIKQNIKPN
jgi:ferredoxin